MSNPTQASQAERSNHDTLRALVKERAYKEGKFILSSGKESDYYFDAKKVLLDQQGSRLFALWILEQIESRDLHPVAIGGLEIGAIPVACVTMALAKFPLRTFVVRKKTKAHGTGNQIEGDLKRGDRVVVVDDVITTGESTMKAVRALEEDGVEVVAIYSLVDRHEGHVADFQAKAAIFRPAFAIEDFRRA
jgi:orotate phosphoribosyltransferase